MSKQHNTTFGFKKVSYQDKKTLVNKVFSDVADNYDIMNDIMSCGIHRIWKNQLCKMIPNMKSKIIDVASGTGDIAFRLQAKGQIQGYDTHITIHDTNQDMLQVCRSRAINSNILNKFDFCVSDAEKLPFSDNSFDYYVIAFGIRNMISIENVLSEALRVLKPTGKFLCLEFSKVQKNVFNSLYNLYKFNLIPKIGEYITSNRNAYQYLAESISLFPDQEDFKTMILQSGFQDVGYKNLTFGVVSIHYGFKI